MINNFYLRVKKSAAVLLALLLLLPVLTLGASAQNPYDEYGDWDDWTDEQWEKYEETWTDEQWEEYYIAIDGHYAQELNEQYNSDSSSAEKIAEAYNLPYKTGPNIIINGKVINYGTALPYFHDRVIFAPAKQTLDAVGASASYESATKKLTAVRGEITATFIVGSANVYATVDGQTEGEKIAAAPYFANGTVYLPVAAVASVFGLKFYTSDTFRIAEILDYSTISADIDSHFTIINRLLKQLVDDSDSGKTQKLRSDFDWSLILYGDGRDDKTSLTGTLDLLTDGNKGYAKLNGALDLGGLSPYASKQGGELGKKLFAALKKFDLEFIWNISDLGDIYSAYLRSNILAAFSDELFNNNLKINSEDWLSLVASGGDSGDANRPVPLAYNFYDTSRSLRVSSLFQDSVVPWWIYNYNNNYAKPLSAYEQLQKDVTQFESVLGDKAFVKSGGTYTIRAKIADLIAAYYAFSYYSTDYWLLESGLSKDDLGEYSLTLTETGDVFSSLSFAANSLKTDAQLFSFAISLTSSNTDVKYSFDIIGRYFGKILMRGSSKISESTELIPEKPPDGAKIYNEAGKRVN